LSAISSLAMGLWGCAAPVTQPITLLPLQLEAQGGSVFQELGSELEYSYDLKTWRPIALPATRMGFHITIPDQNIIWLKSSVVARTNVLITRKCIHPPERYWFELQAIAEANDYTVGLHADRASRFDIFLALAKTDVERGVIAHAAANHLWMLSKTIDAERYFQRATDYWSTVGFKDYQYLAQLGQADLASRRSDLNVARKVIREASINDDAAPAYFRIRLKDLECNEHLKRGDFAANIKCLSVVSQDYAAIGEVLDSANTWINLISKQTDVEIVSQIGAIRQRLVMLPFSPSANVYRGRILLKLARALFNVGEAAHALSAANRALFYFNNATEERARWLINTYALMSEWYSNLGIFDQSFELLYSAIRISDPTNSPSGSATLLHQLGLTFAASGDKTQGRFWLAKAISIRRALGLTKDVSVTALAQLNMGVNDVSLESLRYLPKGFEVRLSTALAEIAYENGSTDTAQSQLEGISKIGLGLVDRATLAMAQANVFQSDSYLREHLDWAALSADQAPTAALAYLSLRSAEKVRQRWVDSLTVNTRVGPLLETVLRSNPARFLTSVASIRTARVDPRRSLPGKIDFLDQITLLQSSKSERFKAFPTPALASFQARMPAGGLALLLVPGEKQSLALWIDASRTRLQLLPGRKVFQNKVAELSALTASPASSRAATESAARSLSEVLFAGFVSKADAPPSSLWVLADELPGAIPFSALYWPGQAEPLVASTEVSLITGLRINDLGDLAGKAELVKPAPVFFAPLYDSKKGALQALDFAEVERRRIEMQSERTLLAYTGVAANRHAFQDLVQTPGIWMHVAAHGRADPGVMGNAGLWLSGERGEPDFLSWLELGNLRVQAELLVLNACQSATGAQPSRQANVSFALAMSASGARNVVAALWPVSDAAAGTWIPAFYRNLADSKSAEQSGAALRQAQLALYRSPHYRQPFYWASLVHFRRLDF